MLISSTHSRGWYHRIFFRLKTELSFHEYDTYNPPTYSINYFTIVTKPVTGLRPFPGSII